MAKTKTKTKRRSTPADQEHIEGTEAETDEVELTAPQRRQLHRLGNDFCDKLAQKEVWHEAQKKEKKKVDAMLLELGLTTYRLPSGHTINRSDAATVTVSWAKNDEGLADTPEPRRHEVTVD